MNTMNTTIIKKWPAVTQNVWSEIPESTHQGVWNWDLATLKAGPSKHAVQGLLT